MSNANFYSAYGVPPERIVLAPYSVDTEFFSQEGALGRARRQHMLEAKGLDPTLTTIILPAKLQPYKRPLDALAAFKIMRKPANLLIVGDGPMRAEVEIAAREQQRCRVLGFVNQSEIGRWYGAADLVLLPSQKEPWGLAVNEAMAAGALPVVSSEVGCAPDLVRPGLGEVFPVGDVSALAGTLDILVADRQRLQAARKAVQRVSLEYSVERTARGFEEGARVACSS